jgi:hypothetical protein
VIRIFVKIQVVKSFFKLFLVAAIFAVSCGKDDENGSGVVKGTNKLIVSVVHHTYSIPGIEVYLKYNATEFPGTDTTKYEWMDLSDNSGIAEFENLFEGNYFIYAKGLDQQIGLFVAGASQVVLNSSSITNNEAYVTLYVTE